MQKFRNTDIKPFEFSDLDGTHVVSSGEFKDFDFKTLTGESYNAEKVSEEDIRTERTFAKEKSFQVSDIVRNSRGLARQEQSDLEKQIQEEVNKRLEKAFQDAYNEGLEKGREEGKQEAFSQYQEELAQRIEDFGQTIEAIQGQSVNLIEDNRKQVYDFIKRFTKWIVLKEINEKVYLESLLEKLILELNARKNLIVKVGRANFSQMPEVIQTVESRLGQLSNLRVEIVPQIQHPGIILESENGLIDGSLEGVFGNIDKIFEQVLNHE